MATLRTHHALWDAAVGVAAALLVFCAVPGVLIGFVGLPVPAHWTERAVASWHGAFDLLAVLSWCAWAACGWPILRAVAARVRSRDVGAARKLSDRIAVRIAIGVLALSAFLGLGAPVASAAIGASVAASSVAGSSPLASSAPPASLPGDKSHRIHQADPDEATVQRRLGAQGATSCVVEQGDTLASLAAACYGDPSDWSAIAAVNLGRLMDDKTRFVDPSIISPGWTLVLPALDTDLRTHGSTMQPSANGPAAPVAPTDELGAADPLSSAGSVLPFAELAAAGVSALVAGLLARRARQLRRLRAFLREEGEESPDLQEREADLGALLVPFERVPIVDMVEVAARHLGEAIATLDPAPGAVQWLRAGCDGVEVRFSDPVPEEVRGWRRTGNPTWLLPATIDVGALQRSLERGEPWCAALVPLGDDDRGTWLLPIDAGSCVAVVGPRAADLVLAMRAAVATWSWHEDLIVTDRVDRATDAVHHTVQRSNDVGSAGPHVLFVGDPDALSAETRRACAVLTARQVDDADVTVVVDARAASAHPLGLTIRPTLLDPSWTGAVEALIDPEDVAAAPAHDQWEGERTAPSGSPDTGSTTRSLVHQRTAAVTLRVAEHDAADTSPLDLFSSAGVSAATGAGREAPAARAQGSAEVRLLATVPGIVGLQAELPAKRARRAVELVAYLAMHAPDPVTGDRIRTRVLGSADADAAAKTLFNTVGAARRGLGVAPDGQPLLPLASHSGHYRLSPLVTVDALRACALLREGLTSRNAVESVTRLHEGLELVKGEPLGGILTGYAWWRAEGHERRVADAVVDGACALVRAALGSGDLDLARWALTKARMVEPYSESLTRAAMRVAAASGDAHRLRAEWQECQRQLDELDPGGALSERTERLYGLLRAQLAGAGAESPNQASFAAIEAAPLKIVPSAPSTV